MWGISKKEQPKPHLGDDFKGCTRELLTQKLTEGYRHVLFCVSPPVDEHGAQHELIFVPPEREKQVRVVQFDQDADTRTWFQTGEYLLPQTDVLSVIVSRRTLVTANHAIHEIINYVPHEKRGEK